MKPSLRNRDIRISTGRRDIGEILAGKSGVKTCRVQSRIYASFVKHFLLKRAVDIEKLDKCGIKILGIGSRPLELVEPFLRRVA